MRAIKVGFAAILSVLMLAGCGTFSMEPTPAAVGGRPEISIAAQPSLVRSAMAAEAIRRGYSIRQSSDALVVEGPTNNVMAKLLVGNGLSAHIVQRISFAFIDRGGATQVVADYGLVTNPGTSTESMPISNPSIDASEIQKWLDTVAAKIASDRQKLLSQ